MQPEPASRARGIWQNQRTMADEFRRQLQRKIADAFADLQAALREGSEAVRIEGASGAGKAALLAALLAPRRATALVITYNEDQARQLAADLAAFLGADHDHPVLLYPSIASALYDGVSPQPEETAQRLKVLERLCAGEPTVVVAAVKAVLHLTMPRTVLEQVRREVTVGQQVDRDELGAALIDLGYEGVDLVDDVGQFSIRGGILDLAPPTSQWPVRVEFFGNEIENLRYFDPVTQRSLEPVQKIGIGPAGEILLTEATARRARPAIQSSFERELEQLRKQGKQREAERLSQRCAEDLRLIEQLRPAPSLTHYLPYLYDEPGCLCDYLPEDAYLVVDEPVRLKAHAEQFESDVHKAYHSAVKLGSHLRLPAIACMSFARLQQGYFTHPRLKQPVIYLTMLGREVPWAPQARVLSFNTPAPDSFGGKFDLLVEGLAQWQQDGKYLVIASADAEGTAQVLGSRGLSGIYHQPETLALQPGNVNVLDLDISNGFTVPSADLIVLTGQEIFGWRKLRRPPEPTYQHGFSLTSLRELHEGDYVVHINHGIAIYRGLSKQQVGGIERDYLVLEYAGDDRLYGPVTQLDRVQKYLGAECSRPQVTALRSGRWKQAKKRAKASTVLLARELMKLYAARERAQGYAFGGDGSWLTELENSFRYEETPAQWQAIQDVKQDMQEPMPMDRLICGDVGYGKTEVAVRAAFKAVLDGKQAAVMVPTTVLAQQHYNTFRERLARYPVQIAMLSRFRSPEQQQQTIRGLKDGTVDIVIGTHRLLGSDIDFKDLGLVVIDEEQRFGVRQKEHLKRLRQTVDVITLTATPIPRTLNMALSGIRNVSLINDPPQGRMPIRTFVRERDDELIRQAIVRELERGGQVYFVHNRVNSINHIAAGVQRLVPEATVAVAHGQLPDADLEQVMLAFYAEEFDVLVCTTIIENGLDVPNVNTIIIDQADKLGLAQLYQLRGRVGRSNRQAYAYLLYKYPERMTVEAEQRLKAIEEFSELGSGFKLALRDLEIRGAGDILGGEQSGHLSAVGLDLYCRMLADAVKVLKGERVKDIEGQPSVDLPVEAVIPAAYVPSENQRIALYRQLAAVQSDEEIDNLVAEMQDRYGEPPGPVQNLVRIARLKLQCLETGVADIAAEGGRIIIRLSADARLSAREVQLLQGLYLPTQTQARRGARSRLPQATFSPQQLAFAYKGGGGDFALTVVQELVGRLADRVQHQTEATIGQPTLSS